MSVKITKGTYGYVSCIIDDTFYNYCHGLGEKTIYSGSAFTEAGTTFLQNAGLQFDDFYCTFVLTLAQDQLNITPMLTLIRKLIPNASYSSCGSPPVGPAYDRVLYSGTDSYINITQSSNTLHNNPLILYANAASGGTTWGDGQKCSPFGYMRAGLAYLSITVFNSNKSAVTTVRFMFSSSGTAYITAYEVTGSTVNRLSDLIAWFNLPDLNGIDPYSPGGTSEPTPPIPPGDFDNTSDPISPAPLPTLSAVDAKFITLFSPSLSELQALASYMWSVSFDLDTFKKLFTDPMAAILGLSIVPVTPSVTGTTPVTLGNITTSVSMPKVASQYITVSCGTLNVNEYWGAYLDYSPYTKMEIFLPYIGIQTLDSDDIMGRSVTVTYNIDILSGACVAMLTCGNSVLYSFAGSCATSVPITGRDWTNVINGVIGIATGAAGIAIAGATGGAAVAAGAAGTLLGSTANSLTSMKPTVQKSGTMASAAGMLGIQRPYLILTRPRQALPQDQNTYTGYPSYITMSLGSVSGYTIIEEIHLDGVPCTADEHDEIMSLLKEGVIF